MNLFRGRDAKQECPVDGSQGEIIRRLDAALTIIFSEDGKRTVLYYMTNKFGLTLEQASLEPSKLERALTDLLGEIGWMVVKRAILEEFWNKKVSIDETVLVERASLRDAFGLVGSVGLGSFLSPR